MQLLPQYRQLDRAKKKEKYEESLNLIQELIDCDDFEDISTLRVCTVSWHQAGQKQKISIFTESGSGQKYETEFGP